jgi:D-sedoheptulose 7-phosphate isomerase
VSDNSNLASQRRTSGFTAAQSHETWVDAVEVVRDKFSKSRRNTLDPLTIRRMSETEEERRATGGIGETSHSVHYLAAAAELARAIDPSRMDAMARGLAEVRARGGRLFILGVGGGAGHASHAVNDFRKLCALESYAPTDNVSELTARTNDDGWETSFSAWLDVSRLSARDALLVFSVGGGSRADNVSVNLVRAMEAARAVGASLYGVVGAPGGTLAELADVAVLVEPPPPLRTPLVESFQAVVWHGLVSHPELAVKQGHWESLTSPAKA